MRACMVSYSFYERDNRVMRYAEALAGRGDEVDVVSLRHGDQAEHECLNSVNVHRIQGRVVDEKGKLSYLKKLVAFFFKSAHFLAMQHMKNKYDLIHVHSVPDFEVFAALLPKLKGAKVILDIHDIVPEFYASKFKTGENSPLYKVLLMMERLSSGFADHVIISNHLWHEKLVTRSVSSDKCSTILNYPDTSIFHKRPRTRTDDKFQIIYPGTVNWHQGLDVAVRAFALVKDRFPHAEFHIYSNKIDGTLPQLVEELNLQGRVLMKKSLPLKQIAKVMADADLGVIPKRNDPFGGTAFSTKTLEFMASGVPLIVAATTIDRYYFKDNVVKFFKPGDVQDLATAMASLIANDEARETLAMNGFKFVQELTWDNKKDGYFDLVDKLTNADQQVVVVPGPSS